MTSDRPAREPEGGDRDLADLVAIVTGGSQGIGEAIAARFAADGAAVTICARRGERVQAAAARITERGGHVLGLPADVRQQGDVRRVVDATVARFGRLDILVNNAGSGLARISWPSTWKSGKTSCRPTSPVRC